MYANLTQEYCTGTGDTMTLGGATTGNIPFSASFSDGDKVAYVILDSGGTIKVAGIGTYNDPANTITRNDTWSYNGTVDNSPTANVALSAGQHTIRCEVINHSFQKGFPTLAVNGRNFVCGSADGYEASHGGWLANTLYMWQFRHYGKVDYTQIGSNIETAVASSNFRCGIYAADVDGTIGDLVVDSGDIDSSTTGEKLNAQNFTLDSGLYWAVCVGDAGGKPYADNSSLCWGFDNDRQRIRHLSQSFTYGALPSTVAFGSVTVNTGRQHYVIIR